MRTGCLKSANAPTELSLIHISSWNTNLTTLIIETTPPQDVARVVALTLMGGTVGGSLSTLLTGRVIKMFGYVPVFTALGFIHLTAYGVMSAGLRRADGQTDQDH